MKCEIDIIVDRKKRWELKEVLIKSGINIREWFVEFSNEKSIVSFEVDRDEKDLLESIFKILKNTEPGSRIILPNGQRVNPFKENFDKFYNLVCEYTIKE